jgi:hypothetical protein
VTDALTVGELRFHHPAKRGCPICAADMNRVSVLKIGYTFEICHCNVASYPHLAEQPWHRQCLGLALVTEVGR